MIPQPDATTTNPALPPPAPPDLPPNPATAPAATNAPDPPEPPAAIDATEPPESSGVPGTVDAIERSGSREVSVVVDAVERSGLPGVPVVVDATEPPESSGVPVVVDAIERSESSGVPGAVGAVESSGVPGATELSESLGPTEWVGSAGVAGVTETAGVGGTADATEVAEAPVEGDPAVAEMRGRPWDPAGPRRIAKLAGAAAGVIVLLVVALSHLPSGGDGERTAATRDAAGQASGTEPAEAPAGSSGSASGTTAAVGTPGTDPATATPPADMIRLGEASPAKTGSYRLRVSIDDRVVEGTYSVAAGSDGATQVHRTEVDGSTSEQQLRWADGGVTLLATTSAGAGSCQWSPAPVLLPGHVELGGEWSSASDCEVAQGGTTLKVHQESSATVVGRGQTSVAGRAVEVWVVQRHETQTREVGGASVTSDVVSSELVAPQLGLVIERMTRGDVVQPDGSSTPVTVTERLENLV